MYEGWVASGLPPADFWEQTPRLYLAAMRGIRARDERDAQGRTIAAWLTARLMRAQKLPDLDKLLRPARKSLASQTAAELQMNFDVIAARWCGPRGKREKTQ